MADPILLYAVGVFVATLFGFEGRARWLLALFALAPDLDHLTAYLVSPIIRAQPSWSLSDARALTWALGADGLLHSGAAVLLVGLSAALFSFNGRLGGAAGVAWGAHLLLDVTTDTALRPFWPATPMVASNPIFSPWEPILVALAVLYLVGMLMMDVYLGYHDHLETRVRFVLRRFGPRLAKGSAQMLLIVVLFLALAKGVLVSVDGLQGHDVDADSFPGYVIAEPTREGYEVSRWEPWGASSAAVMVRFLPAGTTDAEANQAARAMCVYDALFELEILRPVAIEASLTRVVIADAVDVSPFGDGAGPALVLETEPGDATVFWSTPKDTQVVQRPIPDVLVDESCL